MDPWKLIIVAELSRWVYVASRAFILCYLQTSVFIASLPSQGPKSFAEEKQRT